MNALLFSWVEALQLVSSQWTSFLPSSLAEGFSFSLEPFSGTLFPESGFIQKNGELQAIEHRNNTNRKREGTKCSSTFSLQIFFLHTRKEICHILTRP